MTKNRLLLIQSVLLGIFWIIMAIHPVSRADWLLENALLIIFVGYLAFTARSFPLSGTSYTLIALYIALHITGAHYTYSLVPYDDWAKAIFGQTVNETFGWSRNHFDRLVHFSYGLLLAYPVREVFLRIANVRGFWGYFLPLDVTMSTSLIYELIEWAAALYFGGELGDAYLGTQGDVWDAQKDMALASLGALITMGVTALVNVWTQRDFAREWADSLRVKHARPLGEEELKRRLK